MAYSIITHEGKNNQMYLIAYRKLPFFEVGVVVPNYTYYIQYIENKQPQIFDTSICPYKLISFGDVMELEEKKIKAIINTMMAVNELSEDLFEN
jgi:hypothetical protein